MSFLARVVLFSVLSLVRSEILESSSECGIRHRGTLPFVEQGRDTGGVEWPWHTAVFHKQEDVGFIYAGGATLISERHVLTAAHLVVKRQARKSSPAIMREIELHFGQHNLSMITDNVVIRDIGEAHVHPEYAMHRNDIAVLVMRLAVEYSGYVRPICLDQNADRDLRELEGQRGWITGWGTTENGTLSDVLRTISLPVVGHLECLKDDPIFFGNVLDEKVYCAGDRNGTSARPGHGGGGMYVNDGDRWVLRGIVSFGKINALRQMDPFSYTVFVNVQQYLPWIKEIIANSGTLNGTQL